MHSPRNHKVAPPNPLTSITQWPKIIRNRGETTLLVGILSNPTRPPCRPEVIRWEIRHHGIPSWMKLVESTVSSIFKHSSSLAAGNPVNMKNDFWFSCFYRHVFFLTKSLLPMSTFQHVWILEVSYCPTFSLRSTLSSAPLPGCFENSRGWWFQRSLKPKEGAPCLPSLEWFVPPSFARVPPAQAARKKKLEGGWFDSCREPTSIRHQMYKWGDVGAPIMVL